MAKISLQAAPEPPNVLFIAVDDLKPVLGCYGIPIVKTPNMDRLAARGVLFERAYVNQAVCSPSRNTLMLGLPTQTLGIYDLPAHFRNVYPDAVTMSQTFMKNGYLAEGGGKIYHAGKGNRNDDLSWSVPHWEAKGDFYSNPTNLGPTKGKKGAPTEGEDVADNTYQDGKVAEEAILRLKKASKTLLNHSFSWLVSINHTCHSSHPRNTGIFTNPATSHCPSAAQLPMALPPTLRQARKKSWAMWGFHKSYPCLTNSA